MDKSVLQTVILTCLNQHKQGKIVYVRKLLLKKFDDLIDGSAVDNNKKWVQNHSHLDKHDSVSISK